jgi:hypothetical protein
MTQPYQPPNYLNEAQIWTGTARLAASYVGEGLIGHHRAQHDCFFTTECAYVFCAEEHANIANV